MGDAITEIKGLELKLRYGIWVAFWNTKTRETNGEAVKYIN